MAVLSRTRVCGRLSEWSRREPSDIDRKARESEWSGSERINRAYLFFSTWQLVLGDFAAPGKNFCFGAGGFGFFDVAGAIVK